MRRGYLIVLTGIDGSGKTTQADLLVKNLQKDVIDVSYVWSRWEPFLLRFIINKWKDKGVKRADNANPKFNEFKDRKSKLLDNPFIRWLWLVMFFIDYGFQIFVKIRVALFKKQLIISDRIFYDSVIDQAINLGDRGNGLLNCLDSFWMNIIFPVPDLVIYVDCPGDIAFSRKDDAPNINYLSDRRELYLKLADKYRWTKVDGTLPVDEIAVQIKDEVYKKIPI